MNRLLEFLHSAHSWFELIALLTNVGVSFLAGGARVAFMDRDGESGRLRSFYARAALEALAVLALLTGFDGLLFPLLEHYNSTYWPFSNPALLDALFPAGVTLWVVVGIVARLVIPDETPSAASGSAATYG